MIIKCKKSDFSLIYHIPLQWDSLRDAYIETEKSVEFGISGFVKRLHILGRYRVTKNDQSK